MKSKWETFIATAYCPCKKCGGEKAEKIMENLIIAADSDILPIGTLVEVEDVGYKIVQDTGREVKGNRIKVYLKKHKDVVEFGEKEVKLRVIAKGEW